jgi:hypothetical protein
MQATLVNALRDGNKHARVVSTHLRAGQWLERHHLQQDSRHCRLCQLSTSLLTAAGQCGHQRQQVQLLC